MGCFALLCPMKDTPEPGNTLFFNLGDYYILTDFSEQKLNRGLSVILFSLEDAMDERLILEFGTEVNSHFCLRAFLVIGVLA
jgi:hypothetical protein